MTLMTDFDRVLVVDNLHTYGKAVLKGRVRALRQDDLRIRTENLIFIQKEWSGKVITKYTIASSKEYFIILIQAIQ